MIYIGADHGGFELKESLKKWLMERDEEVEDMGAEKLDKEDDFVDYAAAVAESLDHRPDKGIVMCRNGVGVSVVANRYPGIRCVLGFEEKQVEKARSDDDVNCLALPADYISIDKARKLVEVFLTTKFSGEDRFRRRLAKIETMEQNCSCGDNCNCNC